MKILIIPDKFKTTLSSRQAANAIARGIRETFPGAKIECLVASDGGEGFLEAVGQAEPLKLLPVRTPGPDGRPHTGHLGVNARAKKVYIESCQATGFHLIPEKKRNPFRTSSAGLARLLDRALALGPREIYIGLGSSATCDAGLPVAENFGWRFYDGRGKKLAPEPQNLLRIERFDRPAGRAGGKRPPVIYAVADVTDMPAAGLRRYTPQKGAGPAQVEKLAKGMLHLLAVMKRESGRDFSRLPGGAAAGCLALGLRYFFDARIIQGAALIFEKLGLKKKIAAADTVITGEGSFDEQSFSGKLTGRIVDFAARQGKKIFLVTGKRRIPPSVRPKLTAAFSVEELIQCGKISGTGNSAKALRISGRKIGIALRGI